jgi:hypothetical protein
VQINRNGFVFRNAYAFTARNEQPAVVDGCTLLWRFLWIGSWRTLINLLLVTLTLILAVLMPVGFAGNFLVGRSLYLHHDYATRNAEFSAPTLWGWFDYLPEWLFISSYRSRPNYNWPRVFGFRVLPIVVVIALLFAWGEYALWSYTFEAISRGKTAESDFFVFLFSVQAVLAFILFVCACIVFSIKKVRESEFGQLAGASYHAFKTRTCPVVEIVD